MSTKGEYRVGVAFNPSGDSTVNRIKRAAADLIDMIEAIDPAIAGTECLRLKALAQTAIEDGAMWAVKAATKETMPGGVEPMAPAQRSADPFIIAIKAALVDLGIDAQKAIDVFSDERFLHQVKTAVKNRGFSHFADGDLLDALKSIAKGA